jgi:hypothetical protein
MKIPMRTESLDEIVERASEQVALRYGRALDTTDIILRACEKAHSIGYDFGLTANLEQITELRKQLKEAYQRCGCSVDG